MTVSSTTFRKTFAGDDATTSFATTPITFIDSDDLLVYVITDSSGAVSTLTENTHYTVSGGSGAVGTVSTAGGASPHGALLTGTTLLIVRVSSLLQETDLINNDTSDADVYERALDRLVYIAQQLDGQLDLAVKLPLTDLSGADLTLPAPEANKYIGWNSTGTALLNLDEPTPLEGSVTPTAYALTLLDDTTAAEARTTLGLGTMATAAQTSFVANTLLTTTGDIIIASAANTPARLAAGTATHVLTSNGAGTAPSWQAAAAASSGWSTGDVKLTIKTVADSGWVLMDDGTIGNAASSASTRANADTEDLFALLWDNTADADCAVSGGRGASAAADFAANKRISLPKALGRALAVYGAGNGLTTRTMAKIVGVETHPLVTAELAAHTHTGPSHTHTATTDVESAHTHTGTTSGQSATHTHAQAAATHLETAGSSAGPGNPANSFAHGGTTGNASGDHTHTITTAGGSAHQHTLTTAAAGTGASGSTGSGTAHQNMQPTVFLNVMIKL